MHRQRKWIVPGVLILALVLSSRVEASEPAVAAPVAASPEAVIQIYLGALTSGQYLKAAETLDPEGLEWLRSNFLPLVEGISQEEQKEILRIFGDVPDLAALRKLSPAEFFAALLGGFINLDPRVAEGMGSATMVPIGSVPEGDVVHVVCRTSVGMVGINLSKVEVISLKRVDGNWRVILPEAMKGIVQAMGSVE